MGSFSVPAILPSKVLGGALGRFREYQEADAKEEQGKRQRYVAHLAGLIDSAADGETVQWLTDEIARIESLPREKKFSPRSMPPPSWAKGATGAAGAGQQQQQQATPGGFVAGSVAGSGSGRAQQATPGDALRDILSQITGAAGTAGAAGAATMSGAGASPVPPMPSPAGTPAPLTGSAPALTPLPTPPGRSAPEATPLTGTVPGQPISGPLGQSMATATAATPTPTPLPAAGQSQAPAAAPAPASATPEPLFVGRSPFMGIAERAELPYLLNAHYGMTKAGRVLTPGAKPVLTVKDLVSAAGKGYTIEQVPVSEEYPLGFAVVPIEAANLSELDKAKIALNERRGRSIQLRDKLAEIRTQTDRERLQIQRDRVNLTRDKAAIQLGNFNVNTTIRVAKNYEQSLKFWKEAVQNLTSVEARLDLATGPADYMAILETVHAIDDTAAREGEVATYRGASSIADRLDQIIGRATEGDLLNGTTREQMREALRAGIEAMKPIKGEIDAKYCQMATDWQLDPRKIGLSGCRGSSTPAGLLDEVGNSGTGPEPVTTSPGARATPAAGVRAVTQQEWDALLALKGPDGKPKWTPEKLKAKGISVAATPTPAHETRRDVGVATEFADGPNDRDENDAFFVERNTRFPAFSIQRFTAALPPRFQKLLRSTAWGTPLGKEIPSQPGAAGFYGAKFDPRARDREDPDAPGFRDEHNTVLGRPQANDSPAVWMHEGHHAIYDKGITKEERAEWQRLDDAAITKLREVVRAEGAKSPRLTVAEAARIAKVPLTIARYEMMYQQAHQHSGRVDINASDKYTRYSETFAELGAQYMLNPTAFKSRYPEYYDYFKRLYGREYVKMEKGREYQDWLARSRKGKR